MLPKTVPALSKFLQVEKVHSLEIVLKLTERCNIECTYCYYFFGGDESYKERPPTFSNKNVENLLSFLKRCSNEGVTNLNIVFHGGEPLLLKKSKFREICEKISNIEGISLELSIQTNAMLIDSEWIDIFSAYNIFVGVSIDGPKEYNDLYRIDKQGNGTYQRVLLGIQQLLSASDKGLIKKPGVISVINPDFNASIIYNHLTKHIGLKNLHFLYPDDTYQTTSPEKLEQIHKYSEDLISSWAEDIETEAKIRFIDNYIYKIRTTPFRRDVQQSYNSLRSLIITVDSEGNIGPEDTLRSIVPEAFGNGLNIANATVSDITSNTKFMESWLGMNTTPKECEGCGWKSICRGGELKNRYNKKENSFENKSIYCSTIQATLESLAAVLYKNNMSIEKIESNIESYVSI
ncbi:MAG: radical SAM protein [Thalassotalea sp.]|nr:radical SAM protein [Thalassotalea sp.]